LKDERAELNYLKVYILPYDLLNLRFNLISASRFVHCEGAIDCVIQRVELAKGAPEASSETAIAVYKKLMDLNYFVRSVPG
jgi:hypothetical protein